MPPSRPSIRTLAIFGLLLVGVVCSFAFHAALTDMQVTYTATAVHPEENPSQVADASRHVVDLDERLRGKSAAVRRPIDRAAMNGSFQGNVPPELYILLDDTEATYVIYDGVYYHWNLTANEETTFVRVQMSPATAETVLSNISSSYNTASSQVRSVIESGSTTGWNVERGIYRRGGTYYAVAPESDTAIASKLLGGFLGYVFTPVGRGYVAVALGLLAYHHRNPLEDRFLTVRRALVVTALAVPVALLGTLLFESGSTSRFVTSPVSALVVASGVVAGVLVYQRRWAVLIGFTGLVTGLAVGAGVLTLGVIGGVLGGIAVLVGLITGGIPLLYGIVFGCSHSHGISGDS
ncbi:hypothetical protein [Haloferax sulfurifontis]|uniref:Uncharacterized protein n=1 Tax=Haloferax sulfurifontis ATCC BAA-897 TaxID=662480 RepID=M0ILH7_9EURY|nr:hypothetical protein [Haloferax sulfurifontis]ELZ96713.1 hypothetical protein C441_04204 [Haloferax sulfurifontis ATCC BAA-897]